MYPTSLLVVLAGALFALAGLPLALAGDPLSVMQAPVLAPRMCQARDVAAEHLNMTWLPLFFSGLATPSLSANPNSPSFGGDKPVAADVNNTIDPGHSNSKPGASLTRISLIKETTLCAVPTTGTQRIETSVAGLGVIALAVVMWL